MLGHLGVVNLERRSMVIVARLFTVESTLSIFGVRFLLTHDPPRELVPPVDLF